MTTIIGVIKSIPSYATDVRSGLKEVFLEKEKVLSMQQLYGISLSVCYSLEYELLLNAVRASAKTFLEEMEVNLCKQASVMTRMHSMCCRVSAWKRDDDDMSKDCCITDLCAIPSQEDESQVNFSMYCFANAILNNCQHSINAFASQLTTKYGVGKETIKYIAKITSLLAATQSMMKIESMRSYDFILRGTNL